MIHIAEFSFKKGQEKHDKVDALGEADNDKPGSEVDCVEEKADVGAFGLSVIEVPKIGI